jgi:hypothetical protein
MVLGEGPGLAPRCGFSSLTPPIGQYALVTLISNAWIM